MIDKLVLHKVATYNNKIDICPTTINYFYGSNGSGKTTISRLIDNPIKYKDCEISWKNDCQLEALVYDKNFRDNNFSNSTSIKGIFTLGKDTKEAKEFIEQAKDKLDKNNIEIDKLKVSLNTLVKQKDETTKETLEKCWLVKKKYDVLFKHAFTGFIGSKEAFMKKCLDEINNKSELLNFEQIILEYNSIFQEEVKEYPLIIEPDYSEMHEKETSYISNKVITGKTDIAIGVLVAKLKNSDWVKKGLEYQHLSEGKCPFCQQFVNDKLTSEIESFFDETYENQCSELRRFRDSYCYYFNAIIDNLKNITLQGIDIVDFTDLNRKIEHIMNIFAENVKMLDGKITSPSIIINIQPLQEEFSEIIDLIKLYCNKIKENNENVRNITTRKSQVKSKVWKFVNNDLKLDLDKYNKEVLGKNIGIEKINDLINQYIIKNNELKNDIIKKESEVTSVVNTVYEINRILKSFGFSDFRIAEAGEKGFYKIIRKDGSDVKQTLSEGEFTFITFLYFYQLIKGSTEASGLSRNKIVVIDDPISSLDSNIIFIVSTLVKNIIKDCINCKNSIKQVFVLTHNVYFYKEITFKGGRENKSKKETYWVVKKINNNSKIECFDENPIQTTYELLWSELVDVSMNNRATIFNVLRRILEYYFNIIGGLDYEKCINEFEGEDKLICKSLISCINDGSHFISDDFVMCFEPESIEKYLKVFKLIFEKMGQISHYNMMMKKEMIEEDKLDEIAITK